MNANQNTMDSAIQQYRRDLGNHDDPDLAQYLHLVPEALRGDLLRHLLDVHQHRWRNTTRAFTLDSALQRFPMYDADVRAVIHSPAKPPRESSHGEEISESLATIHCEPNESENTRHAVQHIANRYRMIRVLGEGNFGTVYLASDKTLKRQVAVKVSKAIQSESEALEFNSFLEESRILGLLDHPRVLPVLDAGTTKDGRQFYVSKYLSGGSLENLVDEQEGIPVLKSLSIVRDIADALQHAHEHNLFHRDVKLANIVFDGQGRPFLADFGLALHDAERRERAGTLAGSPSFMAPEQVRASNSSIDGRADIWALGVVLYRLLTGQFPFAGQNLSEMFTDILERKPRPPRQFNSELSIELEQLTLRCLEKEVESRVQSAAELSENLSEIIKSIARGSIAARDDDPNARSRDIRSALRLDARLIAVLAVPITIVVAAIVIVPWRNSQPNARDHASENDRQAELPSIEITESAAEAPVGPADERSMSIGVFDRAFSRDNAITPIDDRKLTAGKPNNEKDRQRAWSVADRLGMVALWNETDKENPRDGSTTRVQDRDSALSDQVESADSSGSELLPDGWFAVVDEDFSDVDVRELPNGWNDPSGQSRVVHQENQKYLEMPSNGMCAIDLAEAIPAGPFEMEIELALTGGYFTGPLFQVDLVRTGRPVVSIGSSVHGGKKVTTLVGTQRTQPALSPVVDKASTTLCLVHQDGKLKVTVDGQFCHVCEYEPSATRIRLGLTKFLRLLGVHIRRPQEGKHVQKLHPASDWRSLLDEHFNEVAEGDTPDNWDAEVDTVRVERDGADSFLATSVPGSIQTDLKLDLRDDFIMESDFIIAGGYSREPKFSVVLGLGERRTLEIGCYIHASSFAVRVTDIAPDMMKKPWTEFMADRARLRIERKNGKLRVFVGDELFHETMIDRPISELELILAEQTKVHNFRIDAIQTQ